jgi:hypothetical protein
MGGNPIYNETDMEKARLTFKMALTAAHNTDARHGTKYHAWHTNQTAFF